VARLTLRAVHDGNPVKLAIEMAGCLRDAAGDLVKLNPYDGPGPDALWLRFIAWTRRSGLR
jgi:hypothetical protein